MTFAASVALLSAGITCYVAILSRLLSRAPGWQDQRWFSLAALAGTAYAALNVPTSAPLLSDHAMVVCSRLQIAAAAAHSYAWIRYSSVLVGRPGSRTDRIAGPFLAFIALVGALTPAFLPGAVRTHAFAAIGAVYRSADPSTAGDLAYAATVGLLTVPMLRFARAWRHGVPNAAIQSVSLAILLVLAANDALVAAGLYQAPYLADVAFLVPAAAVGFALTSRVVEDARAHVALRHGLERQVADRTADLARTQDALHRAEKLAALGQFAAGVAHEVNNPAAVVTANLQYLADTEADALSDSGRNAVAESVVAVQRIAAIVRQLLDAGRLAASVEQRTSVAPRALVDGAMSVARARFGRRVRLNNVVPDDVHVLAQEGVLGQVLVNLVVNGFQAVPNHRTDGYVRVGAERDGDRVRLVVEDNGTGMKPEVLRRAFEPFFTTKPFGSGTGLGLAVSRGLVASLGGDLRLESEPGAGTRATVELAAAPPPAPRRAAAVAERSPEPRLRLLIVDDEPSVLSSLSRLLDPRYSVETVPDVDGALRRVDERPFDVILSDVMMAAGGGERLYRTLLLRAPALARRVIFFTGGAVTDTARRFLGSQPQPVLCKPLDLEDLARVSAALALGEGRAAPATG